MYRDSAKMMLVTDASIQWLASGVGALFLIGCAWHNRRSKFERVRALESPVNAAILWLAEIKESLSLNEDNLTTSDRSASSTTEQMIRLNSALSEHGQLVPSSQLVEIGASVAADALEIHARSAPGENARRRILKN